jgi:transposase, IS5 family
VIAAAGRQDRQRVRAVDRNHPQGKTCKPTEFEKDGETEARKSRPSPPTKAATAGPTDGDLPIDAVDIHRARLGRTPPLMSADAAFYSARK